MGADSVVDLAFNIVLLVATTLILSLSPLLTHTHSLLISRKRKGRAANNISCPPPSYPEKPDYLSNASKPSPYTPRTRASETKAFGSISLMIR
ncbi:Uncharacterised protein [Porphyromonas crevioricanis]|uniref:Uncharacterized protein n=1 Tax=Porphyromonas crevioricanis TaxID=393921 RepID=A0A2X4PYC4_9PORP|nr:hypothetical protein SAMN02745203_00421 [Porphyromonas crevioricanis]SQH72897.1 Uncharacterised protein [Porphyromonas crevioricanis]